MTNPDENRFVEIPPRSGEQLDGRIDTDSVSTSNAATPTKGCNMHLHVNCTCIRGRFNFTLAILQLEADTCPLPRQIKEDILSKNHDLRLAQHVSIVVEVERAVDWPRLWDPVLDHGPKCIDGLRNVVRVITFSPHALSACPLCKEKDIPRERLSFLMFSTLMFYSSNELLRIIILISH